MQTINSQLKDGTLSQFHLLYGTERFMVRHYKNQIIKALQLEDDEMNCSYYEGDAISISEMIDVGQTLPFFAEKRLIIVENSGFFKSSTDLADMLPELPSSTYLVFVEKEVDKRNRLYKFVQKNGCVTEAKEESQQRLMNWVSGYCKNAGKNISGSTVLCLLQKVGMSMEILANELEKLIAYTGERVIIEPSDIDAVCTAQLNGKIFDMVDAVAERKTKKALALYHDLLELKEPPMRILALFSRQVLIMLMVEELQSKGARNDDIAKKCSLPPFAVKKYMAQGKKIGKTGLKRMLSYCASLDEAVKTGTLADQLAVELFIMDNS